MSNEEIVEKLSKVREALRSAENAIHTCLTLAGVNFRKWQDVRERLITGLAEIEAAYTCFKGILESDLCPGTVVRSLGSDNENAKMVLASVAMLELGHTKKLRQVQGRIGAAKRLIGAYSNLAEAGYRDWKDLQDVLGPWDTPDQVPECIEMAYLLFRALIENDLLPGTVTELQKSAISA